MDVMSTSASKQALEDMFSDYFVYQPPGDLPHVPELLGHSQHRGTLCLLELTPPAERVGPTVIKRQNAKRCAKKGKKSEEKNAKERKRVANIHTCYILLREKLGADRSNSKLCKLNVLNAAIRYINDLTEQLQNLTTNGQFNSNTSISSTCSSVLGDELDCNECFQQLDQLDDDPEMESQAEFAVPIVPVLLGAPSLPPPPHPPPLGAPLFSPPPLGIPSLPPPPLIDEYPLTHAFHQFQLDPWCLDASNPPRLSHYGYQH